MGQTANNEEKKTCFVVMGFGKKTDYSTGRVLDLDKSYRYIIKPAAEAAGLECRRADEMIHSGMIEVPMYEELLLSDVVIADVSTSNCNAFYELGVRHALRPYTTITIAEDKMVFPFDVNHIAIKKYQHLGDGIDFGEVMRMRNELEQAIRKIAGRPVEDSPVYTFLKNLKPPLRAVTEAVADAVAAQSPTAVPELSTSSMTKETVSVLMRQADDALDRNDFVSAKSLLMVVRGIIRHDPYVTQKLALATYKSKMPNALEALQEAQALVAQLEPHVSTDTETLGLWGAIHKRMWEVTEDQAHLETAILAYEKGFFLKNDYYNGINLAYLLNIRANRSEGDEAIADSVLARRTRRRVISICEALLTSGRELEDEYWIRATEAEAWFGLLEIAKAQECLAAATAMEPAPVKWKRDTTEEQVQKLANVLAIPALAKAARV
jgi:hypothetical protein